MFQLYILLGMLCVTCLFINFVVPLLFLHQFLQFLSYPWVFVIRLVALVCNVSLNLIHMSFTLTASAVYMQVIVSFSDAMSCRMRSQLAFLYKGIWRCFWLYLIGLRSSSANTMSWSEIPGRMSMRMILSGWLVMRSSSVFCFLVGSSTI